MIDNLKIVVLALHGSKVPSERLRAQAAFYEFRAKYAPESSIFYYIDSYGWPVWCVTTLTTVDKSPDWWVNEWESICAANGVKGPKNKDGICGFPDSTAVILDYREAIFENYTLKGEL